MVRLSSTAGVVGVLGFAVRFYGVGAMFSVHEDLLAYPQYEVRFPDSPDSYITEEEADRKIAAMSLRDLQQIPTSSVSSGGAAGATGQASSSSSSSSSDKDKDGESTGSLAVQDNPGRSGGSTAGGAGPFSHQPTDEIVYEAMRMGNRRYLCSIPIVNPPPKLNATERRKNKSEEDKEVARATVSGTELLKGMEGTCLYFISGWWSYSFCYNDHIKQFHQLPPANGIPSLPPVEDPHAASYILGRAAVPDRDAKPEMPRDAGQGVVMEMQANGELKYLVQKLAGGTLCDITGRERRIELQYHCSPHASQDRIGYIKEVTTCGYLMVIYTPRLCSDAAFKPPAESRANTVECLEVMNEERIKEYRAEKERREKNLQALLDMVGHEVDEKLLGKLAGGTTGAGAGAGTGAKKQQQQQQYVPKPNYKVRSSPGRGKGFKPGSKEGKKEGEDETYIVTGDNGQEQMVMVREMELNADMLKNLPEGVEIIDLEAFERLREAAGGRAGAGGDEADARMMMKIQEERQRLRKEGDKDKVKDKDGDKNKKKKEEEGKEGTHDEL